MGCIFLYDGNLGCWTILLLSLGCCGLLWTGIFGPSGIWCAFLFLAILICLSHRSPCRLVWLLLLYLRSCLWPPWIHLFVVLIFLCRRWPVRVWPIWHQEGQTSSGCLGLDCLRQLFLRLLSQVCRIPRCHRHHYGLLPIQGKLGPFFSLRDRPPFWRDPCFLSLSSHCPPTLGGVLLGPQSCTWSRWQLFVKAPPMVGPTWTRVRFTLGSDCLPTLSQGTALPWPHVSWSVYCSHARDSMIRVIQGCTSTSYSSMSPWGLFTTSYSVCLHGILYPMTDCYVYDWRRALKPASADALRVSLWFYYW